MQKQINAENNNVVRLFRSPTLETVKMIERTISKHNGECKKTSLWEKLPKKVQWRTYLTILDYLQEVNRIIISDDGVLVYIWNPELARKVRFRKSY